jgi:hypothetical protein
MELDVEPGAEKGVIYCFLPLWSYFWSLMWLHYYARNHPIGTQSDVNEGNECSSNVTPCSYCCPGGTIGWKRRPLVPSTCTERQRLEISGFASVFHLIIRGN